MKYYPLMQDNDSHILHQRRRRGGQGASSKYPQITRRHFETHSHISTLQGYNEKHTL